MNRLGLLAAASVLAGAPAFGQSVISAHSGLIHYVEGRVFLDGKPVEVKVTAFPEIKDNMEFRAEDGRAEVLLNPGVFLRLGENSAIRMISNKLSDTQVEFLRGSAVIESSSELAQKENSVSVLYKGAVTHLRKSGIYRFDSEPAELRVYAGEAEVVAGANTLVARAGKRVAFDGAVSVEKFDSKEGDSLNRWSKRRAEYISMANVSAAKYVKDSGTSWSNNGWFFNPYFGMFTFIPGGGVFNSPYGYRYYAPGVVYRLYQTPTFYSYSGYSGYGAAAPSIGYRTAAPTSSGYSGVMASAPVHSAPAASAPAGAAAPVGRESGHAGGRGR